jgi:hypothetical protein
VCVQSRDGLDGTTTPPPPFLWLDNTFNALHASILKSTYNALQCPIITFLSFMYRIYVHLDFKMLNCLAHHREQFTHNLPVIVYRLSVRALVQLISYQLLEIAP